MKKTELVILILIFSISIALRINAFSQEGGDHRTFKTAVSDFRNGGNPYAYTVKSYKDPTLKHGYAYMPTLLYIQNFFVSLNETFDLDVSTTILWKIPVLIADVAVGVLIYKILKENNDSDGVPLAGVFIWFFNPYFVIRYEYTNYEALSIVFLLLALLSLGKRDFLTGILFACAVSLKTYPVILLPLFLIKTKDAKRYLLGGFLFALLISIPFITTKEDVINYINGCFLVHGGRGIQGRPFLSFITFLIQKYGLSTYQAEFSSVYAVLSLVIPQLVILFLYKKKEITNIWTLAMTAFIAYYLLTPVLNRTHLLWGIPFLLIGVAIKYNKVSKPLYLTLLTWYALCFGYYYIWDKGLKSPKEFGGQVWIDPVYENRPKIGLLNETYLITKEYKAKLKANTNSINEK